MLGLGSGLAGAAVDIGLGALSGRGAKKAAKKQAQAMNEARRYTEEALNKTEGQLSPYMNTGTAANNQLAYQLGLTPTGMTREQLDGQVNQNIGGGFGSLSKSFGMEDFQQDPGYQFRLDEGLKALQRSAGAKGLAMSGAATKAFQRYGQDYASNEFGNAYNRYNQNQNNLYSRLSGVAGSGQTAATNLGQFRQNAANTVGGYITGAGNARAQGILDNTQAWTTGLGNAFQGLQQASSLSGLGGQTDLGSQMPWLQSAGSLF